MHFYAIRPKSVNMKKAFYSILLIILSTLSGIAQDPDNNGNALNFPFRKYGISIGNSYEFNGLRINYNNKNVRELNGVNITGIGGTSNLDAKMTGINICLFQIVGEMQFINLGIGGMLTGRMNGISIGGLLVGAGEINGLSASGLLNMMEGGDMNGAILSGLFIIGEGDSSHMNGFSLSGLFTGTDGEINGIAISPAVYSASKINGLAVGPAVVWSDSTLSGLAVSVGYVKADKLNGVSVSGFSNTRIFNGISIGVFNKTKELQGLQLGLLNYAGNNPKLLRTLPLINIHLGKSGQKSF